MLCPIFRHFVVSVIQHAGHGSAEVRSLMAMCAVLDKLLDAKRQQPDPPTLVAAISEHMRLFGEAYGSHAFKPKHHYMVHLPGAIARDSVVLDCWVLERKHQTVKMCCEWVDNTCNFERTTIARVAQEQCRQMQSLPWSVIALQGPAEMCAQLDGSIAKRMVLKGMHINDGDIIRSGTDLAIVRACLAKPDGFHLLVDPLAKRRELSARAWVCTVVAGLSLLDLAAHIVQHACCWAWEGNGHVLILF